MKAIYTVENYIPEKGVGHLLGRARAGVLAAIDRELAKDPELSALELSSAQFLALNGIELGVADTTTRLCEKMTYDPGAMTRMVDRLEAKGLIQRRRCTQDRRQVYLELTDAGRAAMPRMFACAVTALNGMLQGFSLDEVRQLEGFLTRMISNV